ncbi:hypothetical protein ACFQ78_36910 [Streptomyces sp. NPDC056519]|uniref:hypothetical protein n=1 Tax=Streptomyces sp. NPDC056519 TaxID=3345849 RepID=UPI003673D581
MPFRETIGLVLASFAAVGIAASAVPANAASQVNDRSANGAGMSATDSTVDSSSVVRVFTIKNTTGMDLKVTGVTDPKTDDGSSQWVNRPSIGDVVKNGATASWSATPAKGRTLVVQLEGFEEWRGVPIWFEVRMQPGNVASGITCTPDFVDPQYKCVGGGNVGKRDITLTRR